ncbi:hypothetical protein Ocin01_09414 [Orchesella cincta]|uniref:Uncharacterized protein n=1 Tax=Orchesella cincta TaxID=48709 RepID=A0A1D2MW09_ORCCI|nr:hypothetical protein Ocin01_09414 [Orchesella cincta]
MGSIPRDNSGSFSEPENSSELTKPKPLSVLKQKMAKPPEQYSMLSHEELVSRLIKAQEKIEQLETTRPHPVPTFTKSTFQDNLHVDKPEVEETKTGHHHPDKLAESQSRPTFAYLSNTSSSIISSPDGTQMLIQELQERLRDYGIGDQYKNEKEDEFEVAYEYRGDFPNCDEDLSLAENSENCCLGSDDQNQIPRQRKQRFLEFEDGYDSDALEEFPLIPSPVLNTPPYEYIFLTKENEAKVRIFLNPKLNQVFQEELTKLQKSEEHEQFLEDVNINNQQQYQVGMVENSLANHMDINNRNHLINNCSSLNEIKNTISGSNVIHCFDPSDVDLELKKIFMEKPPITHRIIRRKSRRERGSSVPAVDSYYGTGDLNKVGHASYFIPGLTNSERKKIGWRSQYHYGHWKYSALNVPNARSNQIPLHPHPHLDSKSKHTYHHHESDLPQPFLIDSDAVSILESPTSTPLPCKGASDEDTLSFITLSGSAQMSQSCHIIPDKSALKRVLHWILPCVRIKSSVNLGDAGNEELCEDDETSGNPDDNDNDDDEIVGDTDTMLETLVEPSDKLNSPTSHFQISFALGAKSGQLHSQHYRFFSGNQSQHSDQSNNNNENQGSHHHHHHNKHQHHGFLHWKHILTHGSKSEDSMSVVGGDVVESNPGIDVTCDQMEVDIGAMREDISILNEGFSKQTNIEANIGDDSDESTDDQIAGEPKRSQGRKLKSCKAYTKLLTLKDLGYKSEDELSEADFGKNEITSTETDTDANAAVATNNLSQLSSDALAKKFRSKSNTNKVRRASKKRNRSCTKSSKVSKNTKGGKCNERRAQDVSSSDVGASGNDDDDDDGFSSGYPFSNMTISNQNSFTTTHFCDDLESRSPVSTASQDYTETRFLDSKDLVTPRYQELKGHGSANPLPFVYDCDIGLGESIDYDENVIQWMDSNFAQEIEDELGLLNSCIDTVLLKGLLSKGNSKSVGSLGTIKVENEDIPEKVNGQHRIITLNQRSLENHIDIVNENL